MPQFHLQTSWRLPSVTLQPVHWRFQEIRRGLAPCGVGYKGGIDTSPSWSCRRSLDITSLSLFWQNLRGNHLMAGAGCPTESVHSAAPRHTAPGPLPDHLLPRASSAKKTRSDERAFLRASYKENLSSCQDTALLHKKKKKQCTKVALPFWSDGIHRWDLWHRIKSAPAHCF